MSDQSNKNGMPPHKQCSKIKSCTANVVSSFRTRARERACVRACVRVRVCVCVCFVKYFNCAVEILWLVLNDLCAK